MAKLKVTFGEDYTKSGVEIDGKAMKAQSCTLIVDAPGYCALEVEVLTHDENRRCTQTLRKRIDAPIDIEIDVPDSWHEHVELQDSEIQRS